MDGFEISKNSVDKRVRDTYHHIVFHNNSLSHPHPLLQSVLFIIQILSPFHLPGRAEC